MPRIGGGGGRGPFGPSKTQGAQKTGRTEKSSGPAVTQGTDAARAEQAKVVLHSALTKKTKEIAARYADGRLTQREATKEFVALVIEERFPRFKRRKKKGDGDSEDEAEQELEDAVTDVIDRDPALAKRLSAQFKRLAAKG